MLGKNLISVYAKISWKLRYDCKIGKGIRKNNYYDSIDVIFSIRELT